VQREDLKGEAVEKGIVEAALACLRRQRVDSSCCAALGLLCLLAEDRAAWPRIQRAGARASNATLLSRFRFFAYRAQTSVLVQSSLLA
jgi:hypothetical protein